MPRGSRVRTAPTWPRLSSAERDVLLELLVHGARPRSELADRLQLSRPTLSRVTKALVTQGLLVEGATELRSITGRPSEMLHVHGPSHRFLGVKLTADRLFAAVTDLSATVVDSTEQPLLDHDPDVVITAIAEVSTRFPGLTALGVTLGGVVRAGRVVHAGFLEWTDVPLGARLAEATGVPTAVDNDVQALTAAEHWFGAGVGTTSMVVITIGAGVGTGLIVNGELVEGFRGVPPRFGHILVDPAGPHCGYGHRGCASSFLMTHVILRQLDGSPTYAEAVERVRSGDEQARTVFERSGYALGVLIGTAANVLDPQKILLTGEGLPLYELTAPKVHEGIADTYEDDPALIDLDVQPFDFGEWARSAAVLAIRKTITAGRPDGR
ncbi:ROK family transcriptional regulator [Saccharothrix longispora]|uniref:NBD/HSP70 family sugar kinase n=1 Tax=Saccharothrix longispora TaxID=33920 RepID=A0ABU1PS80_9PSEU|nr:ROK family transcriptional regulator [Saccharothrix longispora]MDR6593506.1 putative NBD/HSP70 family sugar kinase [Saccharothrix longispora]